MTFYLESHAHARKKWEFEAGIEKEKLDEIVSRENHVELFPVFSLALSYFRIPDYEIKLRYILQGVELKTSEGDIIAIGIEKNIPSMKNPYETIELIREQDGIAIVPHPFTKCYGMFRNARYEDAEKFMKKYRDMCYFEKINTWTDIMDPQGKIKTHEFSKKYNSMNKDEQLRELGGSDAKFGHEDFASSMTTVIYDKKIKDKHDLLEVLREDVRTIPRGNKKIDAYKIILSHPLESMKHAFLIPNRIGPYETLKNTIEYAKSSLRK